MRYPIIDVRRTGERLKEVCDERGIRAKDIQEYMNFSAAQSVYDWFRGKSLPSLDNFYALAKYVGMPMERLIVAVNTAECELSAVRRKKNRKLFRMYHRKLLLSTSL